VEGRVRPAGLLSGGRIPPRGLAEVVRFAGCLFWGADRATMGPRVGGAVVYWIQLFCLAEALPWVFGMAETT